MTHLYKDVKSQFININYLSIIQHQYTRKIIYKKKFE